jgi:glucose-1-phosphate thymidylyltransferase
MEIAKAMILAGRGRDECPWPTTPDEPRHLFPVANRPILFHNLEALRAAGVLETAICAEPSAADAIQRAVGDGREWGLSVRYADWDPRVGVAGALAASRDFLGGEPVLVQHGDALLCERLHGHVSAFAREGLDALALRLPRPSAGAKDARMPWYLLSPRAISILGDGGEAAANPVAGVRAQGGRVRIQLVDGCVPCQGDVEALLESNRRMLEGLVTKVDPSSLDACNVQGAVHVHPTATIRRTLLRGPVIIGPGAQVTDAYIGPYTSIGAGVVVEGTEIEHSIVLSDAELRFVGTRLESSVIGRRARIVRGFRLPGAIRMSIGDGAEVVLT